MRDLQTEMAPFAYDVPLTYSKPDSAAICVALQEFDDAKALTEALRVPKTVVSNSKKLKNLAKAYIPVTPGCLPENVAFYDGPAVPVVPHGQIAPPRTVMQPVVSTRRGFPVQSGMMYATSQAPSPLQSGAAESHTDEMDLDQYDQLCPNFQAGEGCPGAQDANNPCELDHSDTIKYDDFRAFLLQNYLCPYGEIECRYSHGFFMDNGVPCLLQAQAQPQPSGSAGAGAVTHAPGMTSRAPKGKLLDPSDQQSYCGDFHEKGECSRNSQCWYLHKTPPELRNHFRPHRGNAQPGFSSINHFRMVDQELSL